MDAAFFRHAQIGCHLQHQAMRRFDGISKRVFCILHQHVKGGQSGHRGEGDLSFLRAGCGHFDSGVPWRLICDSLCPWQMLGSIMGRTLPMALRQRVVAFVEEGHRHRSAAA
ncbi:MAG: hypothetical protein Q7T28_05260, partial [Cypionkella sp.]|uniref:hypothetical protein n=1 Tax=Cypionkella sp. TaxID=2811411 RepID=UPI002723E538